MFLFVFILVFIKLMDQIKSCIDNSAIPRNHDNKQKLCISVRYANISLEFLGEKNLPLYKLVKSLPYGRLFTSSYKGLQPMAASVGPLGPSFLLRKKFWQKKNSGGKKCMAKKNSGKNICCPTEKILQLAVQT